MKKKEYQKQLAKEKKELKDLQLGDKEKNIRSVIIITVSVLAFFFLMFAFILERYNNASSKLPLYKVDLSNSRNNTCKSDKLTISNSVKELKFQVPSLVKVKNGIVVDSYTSYDTIKNTLLSYVD